MRLLHISDWHIGRVLYGEPRTADHDAVLQEITGLARQAKPDLILHTGDVFDTARPAVQDMQRAISWLQELAATAPVAVVAGQPRLARPVPAVQLPPQRHQPGHRRRRHAAPHKVRRARPAEGRPGSCAIPSARPTGTTSCK